MHSSRVACVARVALSMFVGNVGDLDFCDQLLREEKKKSETSWR
jgi:hypothetical protein